MRDLTDEQEEGAAVNSGENAPIEREAIAIIGAAGRFPRARNLTEFWQRLQAGEELVTFFSDEELLEAGVDPDLINHPHYVKARAALSDAELFDAVFFGINPREAEVLDPQQRIFLETAWEALEDAAYDPDRYNGAIGVYGGLSINSYLVTNLLARPDVLNQIGGYQVMLASDKDFMTTRVSYKMNLRGPSVTVQTACSTSLVAVQMACQSLLTYQCDIALAGGVSVGAPRVGGYIYQPGMIMSPDGHCRPFDARGQGIVAGEGAGIVVLKRLSEALADGDAIRAVILGAAINNDGADKVGYTAPSVQGQAEAIAMAQAMAGISPDTIQYVEAHGTGTELGDPIEIAALTQAFRLGTERRNFCAIGSVKSNMGHLDAAAGVAGLLKTVLAMQHRQIPPSLHLEKPNPHIDFDVSPFYVATQLAPWPTQATPRRAGVSSFGIGGTNAHVVLQEAPPIAANRPARRVHLLPLSALTPAALDNATALLVDHLRTHPEQELADVAYTLQVGRKTFGRRRFVVCADRDDAIRRLESHLGQPPPTSGQESRRRTVAFLFPGQGAQYAGMGRDLYATEEVFRAQIDECAALLLPHLGLDLRQLLFPQPGHEEAAADALRQTAYTQPALFVMEYALAQLWMSWGLQPAAMLGHSIGEYVAACLAGVFSLADGLALVAARGQLMQSLPGGSMLAVPLAESGIVPYLQTGLALAAVNAPQMCVVAGPTSAIELLEARLVTDGVQCQRLHTSHAFHSAMMDPILDEFAGRVAQVKLHAPDLPYVSNLTGTWITAQQATDPHYWAQHLRSTVRFAQGAGELLGMQDMILLECGPGHSLASLVKQHAQYSAALPVLPSLRHPHDRTADDQFIMQSLGGMWSAGVRIEWDGLHAGAQRMRIPLPTYPFERLRFWVDVQPGAQAAASAANAQAGRVGPASAEQTVAPKRANVASWFYAPTWKQLDLPPLRPQSATAEFEQCQTWLVFADDAGLGAALTERLQTIGCTVDTVVPGPAYAELSNGLYALSPGDESGYRDLFAKLRSVGHFPQRIVHLWNVGDDDGNDAADAIVAAQDKAFYSLLYITQSLGLSSTESLQLDVVATGLHDVIGGERLTPAKATLLGPCLVIPQELPHITCRYIDMSFAENDFMQAEAGLWRELQASPDTLAVALRGRHRWVQSFEQVPLPPLAQTPALLRPQGVYLITGGLGDIPLAIAEWLAEHMQARLVLTARTALPPRQEWPAWLAEHDPDDATSVKLQAIQKMEAFGSEVLTMQADVTDFAQMRAVIDAAHATFGAIHGVIHAAGVGGGGMLALKTRPAVEAVMAPKVLGTAILSAVLKDEPIDFLLLFSSFNSLFGWFGQIDYSAANAYLDAFAHAQAINGGPFTMSINWSVWQERGMAANMQMSGVLQQVKEESLRHGMRTVEGLDAFQRVLNNPLSQWVVSPRDFLQILALSDPRRQTVDAGAAGEEADAVVAPPVVQGPAAGRHARPVLQTAYVAPRNATETQVAQIWGQLFGIDEIGIHDNFFELGGHSLLATQVLVRLQESFGVDLPVRTIFESHTIAELASQLDVLLWVAASQSSSSAVGDGDREELEF